MERKRRLFRQPGVLVGILSISLVGGDPGATKRISVDALFGSLSILGISLISSHPRASERVSVNALFGTLGFLSTLGLFIGSNPRASQGVSINALL